MQILPPPPNVRGEFAKSFYKEQGNEKMLLPHQFGINISSSRSSSGLFFSHSCTQPDTESDTFHYFLIIVELNTHIPHSVEKLKLLLHRLTDTSMQLNEEKSNKKFTQSFLLLIMIFIGTFTPFHRLQQQQSAGGRFKREEEGRFW